MRASAPDPESTLIATNFTVRQYHEAVTARDRERIADAIQHRFSERYIEPATIQGTHGFAVMAISCLLLESLESLLRGWKKSIRQSQKLFVEFLDREPEFATFRGCGAK